MMIASARYMLVALVMAFSSVALSQSTSVRQALPNGFPGNDRLPQVSVSVITSQQASQLFQQFKNDRSMAWGYPIEGCDVRATAMTQIAERQGIVMAKTFAEGILQARTRFPLYPYVKWGWHTAPSVYVTQPNGQRVLMIIDPAIADGPVTVERWRALMSIPAQGPDLIANPRVDKVYHGTRFQLRPNWDTRDQRTKIAADPFDLQIVRELLPLYRRWELDPSQVPVVLERPSDSVQ